MSIAAALVVAVAVHAAPVERAPAAVCGALEGEGFQGLSGPPKWLDDGIGTYGCAAQIEVGAPNRATLLASAVQFMAESKDRAVVQKVSLSAALFNPKTKTLTLKRLSNVAAELFRTMALDAPNAVFAAIEAPRAASASTRYGDIRFARVEGLNIEQWTLTVVFNGAGR